MPTVLVIDDDPSFLSSVQSFLDRSGYRVLSAADGGTAMEVLEKEHDQIDLVIVDLALPSVNGFEIVGAIARRPGPIKIIATTAIYKDYHLDLVRSLGAHAVIRKPPVGRPLPESQWLGTITNLLGGSGQVPTPA